MSHSIARPETIVIRTLQPMTILGESATGTWADLDIVTDRHGLPYIPRSRLNARLRASAVRAVRALHEKDSDLLDAMLDLMGAHGDHPDRPRLVQVDHARFDDDARRMVAMTVATFGDDLATVRDFVSSVTDSVTTVLTQTAVARTRAPKTGSLRSLRTLREGTTLVAPLLWARAPEEKHVRALALAVLGIGQLGAGEGNQGRVSVSLDGDTASTITSATSEVSQ